MDEWIPMTCHCETTLKEGITKEMQIIYWAAFVDSEKAITEALLPFVNRDIPSWIANPRNPLELALSVFCGKIKTELIKMVEEAPYFT